MVQQSAVDPALTETAESMNGIASGAYNHQMLETLLDPLCNVLSLHVDQAILQDPSLRVRHGLQLVEFTLVSITFWKLPKGRDLQNYNTGP